MEKSNSFKRVLAGTLALLTVASSVPADAGSVIGDFFSTTLVANADDEAPVDQAPTKFAVTNFSGSTAKLSKDGTDAKDVSVAVAADATYANIKKLTITYTDSTAITADTDDLDVTVDGYTVIDANIVEGALVVDVNTFTSITANGTTEYEFDGTAKPILFGKHIKGDASSNNTVEVAYIDADGVYQVLTEDILKTKFTWELDVDPKVDADYGVAAGTEVINVKRTKDGTVTNHVFTLTGKDEYAGLVVDAGLLITPLDITNNVTLEAKKTGDFTIPHPEYVSGRAVGSDEILVSAKITGTAVDGHVLTDVAIDYGDEEEEFGTDYALTFEGREDTEAGQTGVLTDLNGKVNDDASKNVNAVNVGLYTATLNFTGNYTGTAKQSFRIMPKQLTTADILATVKKNPVKGIKDTEADKFTVNSKNVGSKVYDRTSDCALVKKAEGDENPFGLTLTTYKAEKIVEKGVENDISDDEITWSASPVTDFSNVGVYKTVVTVSGNYVAADKDAEAYRLWTVTPYDFGTDPIAETGLSRFVDVKFNDNTAGANNPWVGFAVNPASGNIEATFNVRDNVETDLSAQAGALLVQGTDFTVKYRKNGTEDKFTDKIPEGIKDDEFIDVEFTGKGNYEGEPVVINKVPISAYELTPGATVLTKKVGNNEQVKYQYGDTITAAVQDVPQVLSQESRYYAVDLNENGAPQLSKAFTATVNVANGTYNASTDGETFLAATVNPADKQTAIDALYAATSPAHVAANEAEGKGYVVVVFVNRNGGAEMIDNPNPEGEAKIKNEAYNAGYKSFFDSAVGVSKGITVSRREITDSSTVEIEYVNPLLPYIGRPYTADELEANIKSIKVDGIPLTADEDGDYAEFEVVSTKTDATAAAADFAEAGNYTMKLDFGASDETFEPGDNFKGSYTTKLDTQKFSIVATALTAADFVINGAPVQAVYTKDGADDYVVDATTVVNTTDEKINVTTENPNGVKNDYYGYKLAYYMVKQTEEQNENRNAAGGKIVYDGKEWNLEVVTREINATEDPGMNEGASRAKYPDADYEVTGNKQTAAGPYEITISGVKNTTGAVTVKWKVEGNTFEDFTATPDKTSFDYNGQGQAPTFTMSRTKDNVTTTLTEGKDFAVEYYNGDTKLDGKPVSVGKYTAKIVGIGAYYGAQYKDPFAFTIAPASDLSITITPKDGADFSYNGQALKDRVTDLFDIEVEGKKLEEDADNFIFKIVQDDGKDTEAKDAKNVGKYKISVTVWDTNYQSKTSDQTPFEITPKEITLSNITANVKTAVYGAPVAQINDSITFDYDGVIEADADKVSVSDFRGFVVVSDNYRSGSPAGEYTLVYNGDFVPVSEAAKNYKAKKFTSNEKITVAKKDLADAKDNVTLVVVPSSFKNEDPTATVAGTYALKENQIVYNGQPYEVYIQKNDNGLMTMSDLKLTGTPKALHAGSDYQVVATASADGNYTGTATLSLEWGVKQREIDKDVLVTVFDEYGSLNDTKPGLEYTLDDSLDIPTDGRALFGTAEDVNNGKAAYCIVTNVGLYNYSTVDNKDIAVPVGNKTKNDLDSYASEANGDFTVYFYQLDSNGKPIEDTKTTGYPTTGGNYRATVEFSKDFKLVNTTSSEDPDFVPQLAKIGSVDFTVNGLPVDAAIYDLNQLRDTANLNDNYYYDDDYDDGRPDVDDNLDNKATAFTRVYGDAITPNFQIDIKEDTGKDLVTAKVDVTKMRKYVKNDQNAWVLSDAVYDGSAGYYDLEGAVVMNNTDYSCDFENVDGFNTIDGKLVYEVKRSTDYTIQFTHENNVFALKNDKAVADFQVVDNNSGKVMTEGVDYTLNGSNEVYRTGTYTLFVQGIGNYDGTAHADWVVVNGDTSVGAKFYSGNTVSFKDQVEFNFLADIDENYVDGAYVVFTYDHYGTKTEVKKMISKTDTLKDTNGTHYRVRLPLTASEMAIDVKAELFLKNAAKASDTKTRSIKDYAETAISKNLDGSDVLKAMLNYGGYTQVALGNNTSLFANASADIKEDVSAIQPKSQSTFVRPTPYEGTTTVQNEVVGIPQSVKIKFTPKVTYKGTTVMTKSMLYVRHYFTVDPSVTEDELKQIKVSTWFNNYDLVDLPKNSTGYYLDVPAEMAYNLDKDRGTVTVYGFPGSVTNAESYTGDNGSTVAAGSKTYKVGYTAGNTPFGENYAVANTVDSIFAIKVNDYNVVDYCEAIANNSKQSTANKNMVKALYKYYQAAEAYVAKRTKA